MAKDKKIIEKLQDLVRSNEDKFKSESFHRLSKANDKYNKLISDGITRKRGFTLRGIEDIHLLRFKINS